MEITEESLRELGFEPARTIPSFVGVALIKGDKYGVHIRAVQPEGKEMDVAICEQVPNVPEVRKIPLKNCTTIDQLKTVIEVLMV